MLTDSERCAEVRRKLNARPRTVHIKHIHEATGLSVGWLKAFSQGCYRRASERRVSMLHDYLTRDAD